MSTDWHKSFVIKVRKECQCSHEQAMAILGIVIDMREADQQQGFERGFNTGYAEGYKVSRAVKGE